MNVPGTNLGVYVQDEVRFFPWLLGNFGLPVDPLPRLRLHAAPSAGLVFLPREQTAVKLLYGRAFRAPNRLRAALLAGAAPEGTLPLGPEEIRSNGDRVGGIPYRSTSGRP